MYVTQETEFCDQLLLISTWGWGGGPSVVWYVTCWLPRGGGGVSETLVLVRALTKVDILAKVL